MRSRSILNREYWTGSELDVGTLTFGTAGVLRASDSNIAYVLSDLATGYHSFEGNVFVRSGSHYLGNGSLLTGITSMPSDIVANSVTSNTRILAANGSSINPSYAFANATTVGMYLYDASTLGLAGNVWMGNANVTTIDSSGELATGSLVVVGSADVMGNITGSNVSIAQTLAFDGGNAYISSPALNTLAVSASNAFTLNGNVVIGKAGSNAAPSLIVGTDVSTGLYQPAVGQVAVTAGGTLRLTLANAGVTARVNGNASVLSGSAAAPSLVFGTDTSSGLYQPAVGQVAVSTGGIQQLLATATGLTTSNVYTANGSSTNPSYAFTNAASSGMYLSNATTGNVSLTSGGVQTLTVAPGIVVANANVQIVQQGTAAAPSLYFANATSSGMYLSNATTGNVSLTSGGTERLRVSNTASGLVTALGNAYVTGNLVVDGSITSATGEIVLEDLVLDGAANNAVLTTSADGIIQTAETRALGNSFVANSFVTGNIYTFAGDQSTYVYAPATGQVAVSSNTVQTFTVAPGIVTSNANVRIASIGSAAAPSMYFGSDTASGMYAPATGQVAVSVGGVQKVLVDANGLRTDAGHTVIMNTADATGHSVLLTPMTSQLFAGSAAGVTSGGVLNPTVVAGFTGPDGGGFYKNPGALYDIWRTYVNLAAGTYSFLLDYASYSDRGNVDVVIDSVLRGSIDAYGSPAARVLGKVSSISIATPGLYKVDLQLNSKNASSSGYYFVWRSASLVRTA